jgi:4'-phosphopantetheinyl transferase
MRHLPNDRMVLHFSPFAPPPGKALARPLRSSNRRWPDDVDVWCVDVAVDAPELGNMVATLEVAEQQRAWHYRPPSDRARCVSTRYRLRCLPSERLGVRPQDLQLSFGAQGKPYLPDYPRLSFNAPHSGGCALIAISGGRRVGIDLEHIDNTFDGTSVGSIVCAKAEQAALAKTGGRTATRFLSPMDSKGGRAQRYRDRDQR